ncbi:MAG: hypothetical protein ACOC2W_03990 [bacterium]
MSVNIYDPLNIINDSDINNKTPNYEDLMIYVNLKAYRKSKSNIIFNADGTVNMSNTDDLNVNMMGSDPQSKKYTTNWSDNFILRDDNYEGFGITDIDIRTNSSYIPKVTITFVDVRGLNFMNRGEDSPYSVIYDFPPPIFELTIKGYYGKPLKYTLHLTKQNTKFSSETGDYTITVELISNIFAPLTDILFKYSEIISLMHESTPNISIDNNEEPKSIYELVYRLKNVYQRIESNIKESKEMRKFKDVKEKLTNQLEYIQYLNAKNFLNESKNKDSINFYIETVNNNQFHYREVNKITDFFQYCKTDNLEDVKMLIVNENTNLNILNGIRKNIITQSNNLITNSDINNYQTSPDFILNNEDMNQTISYFNSLDITNASKKLYDTYNSDLEKQNDLQEEINEKIDNVVKEKIGFRPTVRNIIKVICDDVDNNFLVFLTC